MNNLRFILVLVVSLAAAATRANSFTIQWEKTSGIAGYEVEISQFQKVVLTNFFPASVTFWQGQLPYGTYTYRLRVRTPLASLGPWGEAKSFAVIPAAPSLIVPPRDSTVLIKRGGGATFEWSAVSEVKKYIFELYGENKVLKRKLVTGNSTILGGVPSGQYIWRVKPVVETEKDKPADALTTKPSVAWKVKLELVSDDPIQKTQGSMTLVRAIANENVFKVGEAICFFSSEPTKAVKPTSSPPEPEGCGRLTLRGRDKKSFAVVIQSGTIYVGKKYSLAIKVKVNERSLTSLDLYEVFAPANKISIDSTIGMMAGGTYYLPTVQFAYAFRPHWAPGLMLTYAGAASDSVKTSVVGVLATVDYYFGSHMYSGFFAGAGLGTQIFSAANAVRSEGPLFALAFLGGAGWQWRPSNGHFNLKLSLGAQYIGPTNITIADTALHGLLPYGAFALGFAF